MTKLAELQDSLPQCMLRDRRGFQSRLGQLQEQTQPSATALDKLAREIGDSRQEVENRRRNVPPLNYPGELPVVEQREAIIEAIARHQVIILCGETGSGKSTQLPKLCLEAGRGIQGLIGHTQPRRIAARSVAQRIASELDSELGDWVGYQVRFHHRINPHSYIKLMTDGILLAEIQQDRMLRQYDTIIIDEAHERSINIDFLLGYLKKLLPQRPELKLIVTSATLEPERLSKHFDGAPIFEVSGRMYPVEVRYRPQQERDTNQALLEAVEELRQHGPGDALVFLSGERAIRDATRFLSRHHAPDTEIVPLFARQSQAEQNRIFRPHGGQRIILATNVAETSLTVPNIRYVIDTGLARISRYSARSKIQHLPIEQISQASANQRKGRCGRVSAGVCIRLYDEQDFQQRPEFTEPEIRRTNLASVILQMQALRLGAIEQFPFVDPPQPRQIKDGYQLLEEIGALKNGRTTKLARQLVKLPLDPRLARFVMAADRFNCLSEALVIASALSIQDPRERPADKQAQADAAHQAFVDKDSDFNTLFKLWAFYQEQRHHLSKNKLRKLCQQNFLAYNRMEEWRDLHQQLKEAAAQIGLSRNSHSADYAAVHMALLTGFATQVGLLDEDKQYQGVRNRRFRIFPGSALAKRSPKWIMAATLIETSQVFAHYVAKIKPQWLEKVAPHLLKYEYTDPHWDEDQGSVSAYEHISLFGLALRTGQRRHYGRIDPRHAREIFIREALVHGRLRTQAPFMQHNLAAIDEVRALEAKARRPDILVDEQELFRHYDALIPDDVYSAAFFEKWYRRASKDNPDLLKLDKSSLMRHGADETKDDLLFPDTIEIADNPIGLRYHFEPGSADDGVTAQIPKPLLPHLDPAPFEWLVPGLLEEKIVQLIKSLPKSYRRQMVPAPDYARACYEALKPDERPLLPALSKKLEDMTGTAVSPSAWDTTGLPEHLKMKFEVIDGRGKVLAYDHDLRALQRQFSQSTFSDKDTRWSIERDDIAAWDFDELPPVVEREDNGLRLQGYPTLRVEGTRLALRVCHDRSEAAAEMALGLARLYQRQLKTQCKFLRKNLPHRQQSCLYYRRIGECDALVQQVLDASFAQTFHTHEVSIRDEQAFEAQLQRYKGELIDNANALAELCFAILQRYQTIRSALEQDSLPDALIKDIDTQLRFLIYERFIWLTPAERLRHYPRYLKAVEKRLEKFRRNPERDQRAQQSLEPYWQKAMALCHDAKDCAAHTDKAAQYRWLVEEWRVSLFAQELKTAIPVSQQRLEEAYRKID